MQRAQSRRSDTSEAELDGIAEQELAKLQRQYRIMEGDRKAYSEETHNTIRKQRGAIDSLQKERNELMKYIRLAGSQQNLGKDSTNTKILNDMMDQEDVHKADIDAVKEEIADLSAKIQTMEKKNRQQKKNMGGVHMSHARHVHTQKTIRVLENRLDKANVKFNRSLAENSQCREQIDSMRKERNKYESCCKKLEQKKQEYKRQASELIDNSKAAYDARDEAQAKMLALKEKNDKDIAQYKTEFMELERIIDHERKLKEFMRVKGEERAELMEGEMTSRRKKRDEKDKGDKAEETIVSYETAFQKIKEATEIEDIDLLVNKFIEVEDKNFALFNYVNELNNQIEMIQEQINESNADIEKFKSEGVEMESQRKAIMKSLDDQLNEETEQHEQYDNQHKHTNKILEQLKSGIDSLFSKINCDKSAIENLLGSKEGITDNNMMQFLGIIEQRTNELLQVYGFNVTKESDREQPPAAVGLLGQGPQPGSISVNIVPPTTGDDYNSDDSDDETDDEQRPLTQQELKNKIMKGINKREGQPKKTQHHPGSATSDKAAAKKKKAGK
ncbi:coiled-coil domain-containing protein 63 [Exaiptasia diaphana]|uniref:ODAD1 central coiled coil region domain-containing protein n=1 Tax=Exaiptasia diaphana TaxID=2652724 RepID=A0A913X893_EXADI|nr:coiled-coil domain-containing protein 63 [Exaiptasia diaphana]XP_020900452.1 coiled-coil domain-containing protein 63 [Exaiptasia diaphana]KXJ14271.1 Coiled-coil domain-containing protein 63 [Exaiptasia diaphana]